MENIENDELLKKFIESYYLLNRVFRSLARDEVSSGGLTISQINVVQELVVENGLTLKELSERVNASHSAVSGIIDRLESRGLVERKQDSVDRRYIRIYASEQVKNFVYKKMLQEYTPLIEAIKNTKHEEKLKVFDGLKALANLIKEMDI